MSIKNPGLKLPEELNPRARSWSKQSPTFWMLVKTSSTGMMTEHDAAEWKKAKGTYLIFGDHTNVKALRDLSLNLIDRYKPFLAAKVSMYARDGQLIMLVFATSDEYCDWMREKCKAFELEFCKFKTLDESRTDHEHMLESKEMLYKLNLANAFIRGKDRPWM